MDKIVYKLVTKGGGVDGMDYTDKGGKVTAVYYDKELAKRDKGLPWCDIVSEVVDVDKARKEAISKLSPLDRLVLGILK